MTKDGKKIGLALSGGGYRAAAYHIGSLRALHNLGVLDRIDVISSISGGSITAAYYALYKENYEDFEKQLISKLRMGVLWGIFALMFIEAVVIICIHKWLIIKIMDLCLCMCIQACVMIIISLCILILLALLLHKVLPTSIIIEKLYKLKFFGRKTIVELPEHPIVAINATEIESNQLITFSRLKVACGTTYKNGYFKNGEIPISLAVMASSAYPMFSPVRVPKKYLSNKQSLSPILVDGGIYDNHGTHKLGEERSDYCVDYIIVSDAGNTFMNRKGTWNIVSLMKKVIDMMMNRIEKLQRRYNEYRTDNQHQRYAYVPLTWNVNADYLQRFVGNIKEQHVSLDLCEIHGISEELYQNVVSGDIEAAKQAQMLVEESIGWNNLYARKPSDEVRKTALKVGTSLCGLSKKKINSLIAYAEWMTEVQVKTYLPNIL